MIDRKSTRWVTPGWADRLWCRLVQSSAGDQVLGVYKARPALAEHLESCQACRQVAADYGRLADRFDEMQQRSFTAPPDFVESVLTHLADPLDPIPRRRSMMEKVTLAGAATLSAAVVGLAALARRRQTAGQ